MARRTDRASIPLAEDVWLHESRTVENGKVVKFRIHVQYEQPRGAKPVPIVRYDCAHGKAHVHRFVEGGRQDSIGTMTLDEALVWCEEDLYGRIDEYVRLAKQRRS